MRSHAVAGDVNSPAKGQSRVSRATPKATDTLRNLFKDEKKPQLLPQSAAQGVDSDDQHLH